MAEGIRSKAEDAQLMTYHPMGGRKSWEWFHEDPWLNWNLLWSEALSHPGAAQVGFMKALFLSRPFLHLIPDQSLVDPAYDGPRHIRAARDRSGRFAIAYSPYGWPIQIDPATFSGEAVRAWWFDPRTGTATEIGTFQKGASMTFDPPGPGHRGNDWVLVIDAADADFPAPGHISD